MSQNVDNNNKLLLKFIKQNNIQGVKDAVESKLPCESQYLLIESVKQSRFEIYKLLIKEDPYVSYTYLLEKACENNTEGRIIDDLYNRMDKPVSLERLVDSICNAIIYKHNYFIQKYLIPHINDLRQGEARRIARIAISANNKEVFELLIKSRNTSYSYYITLIIEYGFTELFIILLRYMMDPDNPHTINKTPIINDTMENKRFDMLVLIIEDKRILPTVLVSALDKDCFPEVIKLYEENKYDNEIKNITKDDIVRVLNRRQITYPLVIKVADTFNLTYNDCNHVPTPEDNLLCSFLVIRTQHTKKYNKAIKVMMDHGNYWDITEIIRLNPRMIDYVSREDYNELIDNGLSATLVNIVENRTLVRDEDAVLPKDLLNMVYNYAGDDIGSYKEQIETQKKRIEHDLQNHHIKVYIIDDEVYFISYIDGFIWKKEGEEYKLGSYRFADPPQYSEKLEYSKARLEEMIKEPEEKFTDDVLDVNVFGLYLFLFGRINSRTLLKMINMMKKHRWTLGSLQNVAKRRFLKKAGESNIENTGRTKEYIKHLLSSPNILTTLPNHNVSNVYN